LHISLYPLYSEHTPVVA